MPLFFFDLSNGSRETDDDGIELAGLDAAREQAIRLVGEMLRYSAQPVWDGHGLMVEVSNRERVPLFVVSVKAETVRPGP